MSDFKKKLSARCLVIIVVSNMKDKLIEFFKDSKIPIFYQMHGIGTVRSEFLNLFGLGDTHKTIMLCLIPKERMKILLAEINQALQLHKRGTGIAISIPLNGIQGWIYKLIDAQLEEPNELEKEVKKLSETITHAMILVTINQGYSDDVMHTARENGATGGTILKGLRCNPSEVSNHFGIPIQEEQEIIAIVVPKENKNKIMTAISKEHGIHTPSHGTILSLPVDAIMGL